MTVQHLLPAFRAFRSTRILAPLALTLLAACGMGSSASSDFGGTTGGGEAARPGYATSAAEGASVHQGEQYDKVVENDWVDTAQETTSTFGVDVDTASYSLMRRDVVAGRLPAQAGVRPEEYANYFSYDYAQPTDGHPFSVKVDGAPSPFGAGLHLVRVGLQGKKVHELERKAANLVFLVDVSGSMASTNKIELVKYTLKQLVKRLEPNDTLSIVTYAGSERVLLEPTPVSNKSLVLDAIDGLSTGGGTNGEGGIRKAYALAEQAKKPGGTNRVVLCTDGDFNVGATGDALVTLVEQERDQGITLTTLGFGEGNYNDATMQDLADKGNGNYAFIDNAGEANRVLGEKLVSTLQVIAKDVKIQVEFSPSEVKRYRLVGYENRVLANEDFADDRKDAGELGAGHSVTAFYEVELLPPAASLSGASVTPPAPSPLAQIRLRYKQPDGDTSTETSSTLARAALAPSFESAPNDLRFAAAVVEYAEILRRSKHSEGARFDDVLAIGRASAAGRADRAELLDLVVAAKALWR